MARTGMANVITTVRQLAACGSADYQAAGTAWWTDDQIQAHLDRVRTEIWDAGLGAVPTVNSGGTVTYLDYRLPYGNLEQTTGGTAVFYIRDGNGARLGTSTYTVDYDGGRITFGADQAGSARYVTARSYDVHEAAARIWESKAAHVADRYDFTADGASFAAGKLITQYLDMAAAMRRQSPMGGITTGRLVRPDIAPDTVPW